jgi:predicted Abi (CAAX) family protease
MSKETPEQRRARYRQCRERGQCVTCPAASLTRAQCLACRLRVSKIQQRVRDKAKLARVLANHQARKAAA